MKLRLRGDSIRLRLTQSEVKQISEGKIVKEATRFLGGVNFQYIMEPSSKVKQIEARMADNCLMLQVPMEMALGWANSQEVALKFQQPISGEATEQLYILIEKDFACLKTRENETEDESDMFINPNLAHGACR